MTATFAEAADLLVGNRRHRWPTPGSMAVDLHLHHADRRSPALDLLDEHLVKVADQAIDRLMIFMPPQEGKSQRVSRIYPLWRLAEDPTLRIAVVSFQAGKAERWGRQIRRDIDAHPELGIVLASDSRSAARLETVQGGGIIAVGLEGGITGEPIDELVIDDPFAGRAEAESSTYRGRAWDWWENNGSTRASERFRVILMHTRWHTDDLAGRLQTREPSEWTVLSIPAIAEGNADPLGRQPGEELPSVRRREPGYFHKLQSLRSPYVFNSIYQQRPVPAEGGLFPRASLRYWRRVHGDPLGQAVDLDGQRVWLRDMWRFATVDLAASVKTSADWTVVSMWGVTVEDQLLLLDRARARVDETNHWNIARPLVERWGPDWVGVEDTKKSMTLVSDLTKAGVRWRPLEPDTDKVSRSIPASNRVKTRALWLPAEADWLDEFVDELCVFPNGAHDDQVDTLSYAALELAKGRPGTAVGVGDHDAEMARLIGDASPLSDAQLATAEF